VKVAEVVEFKTLIIVGLVGSRLVVTVGTSVTVTLDGIAPSSLVQPA
jgi:hypothetical protein